MKRMKNGNVVDPNYILVEVGKYLGEKKVEVFTKLFNMILDSEMMPEEWR